MKAVRVEVHLAGSHGNVCDFKLVRASAGELPWGGLVCLWTVGGMVDEGQEMFSDLHEIRFYSAASDCSEMRLSGFLEELRLFSDLISKHLSPE